MAIDKIGSKALVDCSVAAVDIAPGTVTAAKLASTLDISSKTVTLPNTSVTNAQLAGSIANAKLANSTVTINGTAIALGASGSIPAVSWQSVVTGDTTMVAGRGYFVNTTSGAVTMTLPSSASAGDTIAIKDYAATFGSNAVTIARNSHNIQGVANDSKITTNRASLILVYADSTKGWLYTVESNVADLGAPVFTEATGGTVTTSGNFKIHTFTGDGTFVVSQLGNAPANPNGGPTNVDYRVVAGGGNGGTAYYSGGGGAGGHRTTFPSPSCNAGAFTISVQSYPITVGAGGAGESTPAPGGPDSGTAEQINPGSNSVFSTITSAGGGGGTPLNVQNPADNGGSGGGGGGYNLSGGSGNTPPVSPPQGNDGGSGALNPSGGAGGGGGGAGGAGTNGSAHPNASAGNGGAGVANSITGASVTLAGGGGGGGFCGPTSNIPGGTGGSGGGGNGAADNGQDATANTGGGGGAVGGRSPGSQPHRGGSGGKGIVIIRYKYQ